MSDTEHLRDALPDDLNASEYVGPRDQVYVAIDERS
jgi:hypothetical protein